MIDVLHSVDLEIGAHILSNTFFIMAIMRGCLGGRNYEERVKKLEVDMRAWSSRAKSKNPLRGRLTLDRLKTSKGWPKFKCEAATARSLSKYVLCLMVTYGESDHE